MIQESGCEFCNKRGLPILPLRYAPANAGCGAPHAEPGVDIPMPAAAGQYTRRLLRDGYLYVYDEANNQWDDYWVTEDSYFFRLPQGQKQNIRLPRKFNCQTESHRAMASFITIYKNKKTSNIWLAFSDVRWTDAVRARHQKASYRRLHMRCVNIHAYDSSPDFHHCFAINNISEQVAEYKQTRHELLNSTGFSPYISEKRLHMKKDLLAACEQLAPEKGLAVVLDDPVGIVTDLASMPTPLIEEFNKKNNRKRALNTYIHINHIQRAILLMADQENAKSPPWRKKSAEEKKEIATELKSIGSSIDFFKIPKSEAEIPDRIKNFKYNKPQINDYKSHREITKKDPWQKYRIHFNEKEMHSWRDTYEKEYSEFEKKIISPLAKTHSIWMQSKSIRNYLACNFDRTDPNSGLVYTRVIHACIAGTQDKAPCFDLYYKWFNDNINQSPLLRALILNMDSIETTIKNTIKHQNINWESIPLNTLIDTLKVATEKITDSAKNEQAAIIMEISAVIAKTANIASQAIHAGILTLSAIAEKIIMPLYIIGRKIDFYIILIRNIVRENLKSVGINATEDQIRNIASAKIKQLEIASFPLESLEEKRFLIMVDPEQIKNIPKELSSNEQAKWIRENIKTPYQLEEIEKLNWHEKINSRITKRKDALIKALGWISFALQCAVINKLIENQKNAMSHEITEILHRLNANVIMFIGFITTEATKILAISTKGTSFLGTIMRTILHRASFYTTFLCSLALIGFDMDNADNAFNREKIMLGILYSVQTPTILAATVAVHFSLLPLAIALTIASIGIYIAIEWLKDTKIQEWLARCQWGFNTKERYKDEESDMIQLRRAFN